MLSSEWRVKASVIPAKSVENPLHFSLPLAFTPAAGAWLVSVGRMSRVDITHGRSFQLVECGNAARLVSDRFCRVAITKPGRWKGAGATTLSSIQEFVHRWWE